MSKVESVTNAISAIGVSLADWFVLGVLDLFGVMVGWGWGEVVGCVGLGLIG